VSAVWFMKKEATYASALPRTHPFSSVEIATMSPMCSSSVAAISAITFWRPPGPNAAQSPPARSAAPTASASSSSVACGHWANTFPVDGSLTGNVSSLRTIRPSTRCPSLARLSAPAISMSSLRIGRAGWPANSNRLDRRIAPDAVRRWDIRRRFVGPTRPQPSTAPMTCATPSSPIWNRWGSACTHPRVARQRSRSTSTRHGEAGAVTTHRCRSSSW